MNSKECHVLPVTRNHKEAHILLIESTQTVNKVYVAEAATKNVVILVHKGH